MGWYNVVEPCVVGQLHYARPTAQPIKVDDEVAAPLVEAGNLTPYPAVESKPEPVESAEPEQESPAQGQHRTRRTRRTEN